jgi:hypothetical protein
MIVRTAEKDLKKAIEIAGATGVLAVESLAAVVFGFIVTL